MSNVVSRVLERVRNRAFGLTKIQHLAELRFDQIRINQGRILAHLNRCRPASTRLQDYEFKVFSQWGEDGIIQRLLEVVEISERTFIEFGVGDFSESNCRFLMMNDNFRGFVMDAAADQIAACRQADFYWRHDLRARHAFVTRENINELLAESGFSSDLAILSIDLDGVDYWVVERIERFTPRILICEYNAVFGSERKISVPYHPHFVRTERHYSNLYWGASLGAFVHLARRQGYTLVGTNSAGCNAFFVRNDLMNDQLEALSVQRGYTDSLYRESRDTSGNLTYLAESERLRVLRGLPVVDVETGVQEFL